MTAIKGIDVSVWQGDIAWDRVKADGVGFAMVRAGYGLQADPNLAQNMEGAAAQGIPCGTYLYSRAVTPEEAAEEAAFLLRLTEPYRVAYPAAIDMESVGQHSLTTEARTALAAAFCDTVKAGGLIPAVYASLYWFETMLDLKKLTPYQRWVADWNSQKPVLAGGVDLWQRGARGRVDGIDSFVDLDVSYRDYPAQEGCGENPQPAPEAPAAGTALLLYGVPLYASATARERSATISGRYWGYDGLVLDGRLRITNSPGRVDREPLWQNVTGYIDLSDATPEEAE